MVYIVTMGGAGLMCFSFNCMWMKAVTIKRQRQSNEADGSLGRPSLYQSPSQLPAGGPDALACQIEVNNPSGRFRVSSLLRLDRPEGISEQRNDRLLSFSSKL